MSEEAQDAKWDLLENYIFFVVLPFLTDFFAADHPLVNALQSRGSSFPLQVEGTVWPRGGHLPRALPLHRR